MKENEKMLRPMTLGDVLDYSIEVFKRNIKSIALILLVTLLPLTVLSAVINGLYQSIKLPYTFRRYYYLSKGYTFLYRYLEKPNIPLSLSILTILIAIIGFIHYILLRPVINAAITKVIYHDVVKREKLGVKQVLKCCFGSFGSLVGNWLLYLLIMFGIIMAMCLGGTIIYSIIALIAVLFLTMGMTGTVLAVILDILIVIAAICAIIVFYYYFKVRFYSVFPVIIEKKSAAGAFSRSLELTKKNFWHLSMVTAFAGLFNGFLTLLFSYGVYAGILVNKAFFMFVFILGQLLSAFVAAFMTTVLTMVYINMKVKKEGLDLEIRVDQLLETKKSSETGEAVNE
ncbi:MAG TPA: hypothetical protein VHT34_07870 [Clostridia bacterium]|nr:hypothetical protein [Clostridia bacterium]